MDIIKTTKLNEHVYLMNDNDASAYIVVGSKKVLVIDTMNGYESPMEVVRSITDLPVVVVNTHGHCDHIFGNRFFDETYMNFEDLPIAYSHMLHDECLKQCMESGIAMPRFNPIKGGDVIDLGDLHIEVIDIPGHTPGGILLLLKEDRILFTGDSINRHLWLQLGESKSVTDAMNIIKDLFYLKADVDQILHGHAQGFEDVSLMDELVLCMEDLIKTGGEGDADYKWFHGIDKIHSINDGRMEVCYRTGNI